jgi:large subunit ribosomal protein L10
MRKEQKTAVVENLAGTFKKATIALVSEYRGMSVAETTEVRRKLRAVRGELRVAKNTLIRRAIKDTGYSSLEDKLGGPVGLIISTEDPVEIAKTVIGFKDLGEKFKLRGGVVDGLPVTVAEIQALATLPPKEVIYAQLLGLLQAPATQLVRLLNEPGSLLARVVDAIGKKNGAGEAVAPVSEAPPAAAAPASEAPPAAPASEAPPSAAPPGDAAPSA